jgi:hypothetical protein
VTMLQHSTIKRNAVTAFGIDQLVIRCTSNAM